MFSLTKTFRSRLRGRISGCVRVVRCSTCAEPRGPGERLHRMPEQDCLRFVHRRQRLLGCARHGDVGATLKVVPHRLVHRGPAQLLPLVRPPDAARFGWPGPMLILSSAARRVPMAHSQGATSGRRVCGKHGCHKPGRLARRVVIVAGAGAAAVRRPQEKINRQNTAAKSEELATRSKCLVRRRRARLPSRQRSGGATDLGQPHVRAASHRAVLQRRENGHSVPAGQLALSAMCTDG